MPNPTFVTKDGLTVPYVSEDQMREIDRIAVEEYGLGILQMMENAGRNLALTAMEMVPNSRSSITILAGSGGNGGGGICCARHLHNHGYNINLFLTKNPADLNGSANSQLNILKHTGYQPSDNSTAEETVRTADLVIDALIGYSLKGSLLGQTSEFVAITNKHAKKTLSLDMPTGIDSTTGDTPGLFVETDLTLTLAMPKPGLLNPSAGDIYLADIGIPPEVYRSLGIVFDPFFGNNYRIPLKRSL